MDICLSHISAFRWLMRNPNPLAAQKRARYRSAAPDSILSPSRCRELALEIDPERGSIDFLTITRRGRNSGEHFTAHLQTETVPPKSLIRIGTIGKTTVYIASPELVFMQLAQRRPLEEAVYFGFALCSLYRIVPAAPGGLQQRDQRPSSSQKHIVADRPLTTVKHIESYLNNAKGNRGCAKAHFALKFVRDGSRSPMESALAITLGLPRIHGGFGLSVGQMNHAVRIFNGTDWAGERRYVTRYPDISIAHTDSSGRKTPSASITMDTPSTQPLPPLREMLAGETRLLRFEDLLTSASTPRKPPTSSHSADLLIRQGEPSASGHSADALETTLPLQISKNATPSSESNSTSGESSFARATSGELNRVVPDKRLLQRRNPHSPFTEAE